MKKLLLFCSTFTLMTLLGIPVPASNQPSGIKMIEYISKRNGGLLTQKGSGQPLCIYNNQLLVPQKTIEEVANDISYRVHIDVVVVSSPRPVDETNIVWIAVGDFGMNYPTILVAPENGWAEVNIKRLTADSPSEKILASRTKKEVWRAASMALGASNSLAQPCLMTTIKSLAALDNVPSTPCPEPFNKMISEARERSIASIRRVTYSTACKEGWAPAPTNEIQKAIWDKVHAIPDKPMKIKFDPAAQKGKVTK